LRGLVSRIKIMGDLNIAESRSPQDGHINMTIDDRMLEVRVSTLPTIYGENLVLRLLPKGAIQFSLKDLGFGSKLLKKFQHILNFPHGVILVTGPTGSGKTTTLYAAIHELNHSSKMILTLEDPVEYQMPHIRQVQVNPKAGITFSSGLRAMLRQDPDILMVGEIRDTQTAELVIRSALTGHLVLSTLHTNDAASTLVRLVNMGIEPFLVTSSVVAVLAQRLVRKICDKCKQTYYPTSEELTLLGLDDKKTYYTGKGCKNCNNTGYLGRVGIFSLLIVNDELREQVLGGTSAVQLKKLAQKNGLVSNLKDDGIEKIYQGITTPEEVIKHLEVM